MENELTSINLYNKIGDEVIRDFNSSISSNLHVKTNYDSVDCNYEWLEIIEETIPYLDNILRNPNRFIVNEEDIIKIELAKKITVESIKHLSRNTNLIQDYNKKTGDVKPSKILNISKEESYDTYENRLIYTLIQNMKYFISLKKKDISYESTYKSDKSFEYDGNAVVDNDNVSIRMSINTSTNSSKKELNSAGVGIEERLKKLDIAISGLTNSEVYKTIDKLHIALITPPIKKTNLINKNVNFQYAMKLWAFLQANTDDTVIRKNDNKDYQDTGDIKSMVDETFLLNYLIINSLDGDVSSTKDKSELQDKLVNNMINQLVSINDEISVGELKDMIGKQFAAVKYRNVVNDANIKKIFRNKIDAYFNQIKELK